MKNICIIAGCVVSALAVAQNPESLKAQVSAAQKSVNEKRYGAAHARLTQALNSVGMIIGHQVLAILPGELKGLKSQPNSDRVTASGLPGMGHVVQRTYSGSAARISLNINLQSQNASQLAAILGNPDQTKAMQDQKVVTVGKRKGLLRMNKDTKSAELRLLSGQNMMTMAVEGISSSEADITDLASKINFDSIDAMTSD